MSGDRFQLSPPNPDSGDADSVTGVSIIGDLSGTTPEDTLAAMSNGACGGP